VNLLAIDASTEACSVAILFNEEVFHEFELCPQSHSLLLLPMVDRLLAKSGAKLSDFDALIYGRGPGSFTGVRIGIGVAQGLAFAADIPTIGISTMQAMAQQVFEQYKQQDVIVAIDARMSEVYCAQFQEQNGLMTFASKERVMPPEKCAEVFASAKEITPSGTGWQSYQAQLSSITEQTPEVLYPDARFMLPLAKEQVEQGNVQPAEQAQPVYVRDTVSWKKLPGRE